MSKNICVITAARSEYGLLRWLIQEINEDPNLILQLVVTGSHHSPEYGSTYTEIENDGFRIDEKVEMLLSTETKSGIAKSMGVCALGFATTFERLNPDVIVVLGDRYELLPICNTALVMDIPIAHISGGDITEGAIDDQVRHAITKMASIHFPGTEESARRIIQMGEEPGRVFVTGETNIDQIIRTKRISREELGSKYEIPTDKKWVLVGYHPESKANLEHNLVTAKIIIDELLKLKDVEIIITKSNADHGGININRYFKEQSSKNENITLIDNLGHSDYISILYEITLLIGNSSSLIFETPSVPVAAINIGNRQKGRKIHNNIISVDKDRDNIKKAIEKSMTSSFQQEITSVVNSFGTGNSSQQIKEILRKENISLNKRFYEF